MAGRGLTDGDPIPSLELVAPDGTPLALRTFVGRPLVIFFYPKSDTPGCTREAREFGDRQAAFAALDTRLLGVSKDPPAKLRRFADKHALAVPLASDGAEGDAGAAAAFGTWVEKQLYGKRYFGLERATFLFAADGRLARSWRKVRVPGHVEAVLDAVRGLPREGD